MSNGPDFRSGHNFDPTIVPVHGAFEVHENGRDELITLTRTGRLLRPGDDIMPVILRLDVDLEVGERPYIIHSVNALDRETSDSDIEAIQAIKQSHPGTPIYSLTKQLPAEIALEDENRAAAGKSPIAHKRLTVRHEDAIDLGIALEPSEGADTEFWANALRRTLAVVDRDGQIISVEQPDDQKATLDIPKIRDALDEENTKLFHQTRQLDRHSFLYRTATQTPGSGRPSSYEGLMDSADRNYVLLHQAGKLDGPFELPSVAAARMLSEKIDLR